MRLEDLHNLWTADQELDLSQPDVALRSVPLLHAKYWRLFSDERRSQVALKQEYDALRHAKFEWYLGRMDDADRIARGWPPQQLRIVRQEVDIYISNDPDLVPLAARNATQELKLKFLEDVIKSINGRGYLISSYINWLKFSQGA